MSNTVDVFNSENQKATVVNDEKNLAIWANHGYFPRQVASSMQAGTQASPQEADKAAAQIILESSIEPPISINVPAAAATFSTPAMETSKEAPISVDTLEPKVSEPNKKNGKKKK